MSIQGKCSDLFVSITIVAALNSFSDLCLFVLPIPWVWQLRLPKKQKVDLIIAFGLGLVVIVAGFIRIVYLKQMLHDGGDHDLTLEVNLGIVCASLPSLKTIFMKIVRFGSEAQTSSYNNSSPSKGGLSQKTVSIEMVIPMKAHIQQLGVEAIDEERGVVETRIWAQKVESRR